MTHYNQNLWALRCLAGVILLLTAVLPSFFFIASPVYATDPPTSTPSIDTVDINRNLVTSGDVCIYGHYDIPYGTVPDESASETYIFRLVDTDNTTDKGAMRPFVYFDNGYNDGVFSLYFTSNITWGARYILRISQNPAYFTSPASYDYVIASTDYTNKTSQDDNQSEMASNIIILANILEGKYPLYTLLEGGPTGTILAAPQGETYFRGAIPFIQSMAPSLYLTSVVPLDYTSTNWTLTKASSYAARYETVDMATAENATATQFGVTRQTVLSIIFIIPLCIGALVISTTKFKKSTVGIMVASVFITMGYSMGWVPPAIFATLFQLMEIYTSYVWFLARAS